MFVFFNDTATTEIYTLSLHDALPICYGRYNLALISFLVPLLAAYQIFFVRGALINTFAYLVPMVGYLLLADRKSTRLNSSHANISYAVFCLKKKKTNNESYLDYYTYV